jgi:hypothetical protein
MKRGTMTESKNPTNGTNKLNTNIQMGSRWYENLKYGFGRFIFLYA